MKASGESPSKSVPVQKDWTKGSIARNLLGLSWPIIISESLYLVLILDMFWVAKLGAAAMAGMGIARIVGFLMMSGRWGLIVGTKAMVARLVGAGDTKAANHTAIQAFVVCTIYVVVVGAIGIVLAEPILKLFGMDAEVVRQGVAYMRIMFGEMMAMGLWFLAETIMQASGDTMTPMKISVLVRLLQAALCPALVFGWWLFPSLGISGVSLSNTLTFSLGTSIGFFYLFNGRTRLKLTLKDFHFDPGTVWRIVKLGIPASVMGIQSNFGWTVLMKILAPFGTPAVAGQALVGRLEMAVHLPPMAIGSGAGVLVGQNLGAHQPERAVKSGWLAAAFVEGFVLLVCTVPLLWAEDIVRTFNTDPALVEIGSAFFKISVIGYVMMGLTFALQPCISSAGDTLPPMLISTGMMWTTLIPLALLLPKVSSLGVYGVRWAVVSSWIVEAIAYTIYFSLGRWKRKEV